MFHCPHCHKLIPNGSTFCPNCGYHMNYTRPQRQGYQPWPQPHKKHHYGRNASIAVVLLLLAGGGYLYSTPNGHQTINRTLGLSARHQVNRPTKHHVTHHYHINNQPTDHDNKPMKVHHNQNSQNNDDDNHSDSSNEKKTLATFPSNLQGTWYSYDDDGKLDTIVINHNDITENGHTYALHARSFKADPDNLSHHDSWIVAINVHTRGQNFTEVRGWNQSAGDGESYAEFVHKGTVTMDTASGAGFWTDGNYFKTKALAKHFKNHIFKDEGEKGNPE